MHHAMRAIFGPPRLDRVIGKPCAGTSELFRAVNGIWLFLAAEERFTKGEFVIVPDILANATKKNVRAWNSKANQYKIKVIKPDTAAMMAELGSSNRKPWHSLDGTKVDFRQNRTCACMSTTRSGF